MTFAEFKNLSPGDIVRGKVWHQCFVVTANYGSHVTAVLTVDLTNPPEWDLLAKSSPAPLTNNKQGEV